MTVAEIGRREQIQTLKFQAAKEIQAILDTMEAAIDKLDGEGAEVVTEVIEIISEE
jgi:hypothetical protein